MLKIEVSKAQWNKAQCDNPNCRHLLEYTEHVDDVDSGYYIIKKDVLCAHIFFDDNVDIHIYCRDCVDEIYRYVKSKLDTKLWSFQ